MADDDPFTTDPLTEAMRRLLAAGRRTEVDDDTRTELADRLDELTARLLEVADDGPLCETGHKPTDTTAELRTHPMAIFPFSPAIGIRNPMSPAVRLEQAEDGSLFGTASFSPVHNGPPWDVVHGGVVALLFDELLGLAGITTGQPGFTGRLIVNYRRPTPLTGTVEVRSWVEGTEGRKTTARAEIRHGGELLSEAEGLFIRPVGGGALTDAPTATPATTPAPAPAPTDRDDGPNRLAHSR